LALLNAIALIVVVLIVVLSPLPTTTGIRNQARRQRIALRQTVVARAFGLYEDHCWSHLPHYTRYEGRAP
jgi:hypothetical protein